MRDSPEMRVAFYGGSFDPPHVAHVLAAAYALSVEEFELVLVVPVFEHAFDKELAPFEHRANMCELGMGFLPHVEVSRIEQSLETPSRTLYTLRALAERRPDWRFRLVIGADVLVEAQNWHAFDEVARLAPPFVLGRIGVEHAGAPPAVLPDVSSTRVRELLYRRPDAQAVAELERVVPLAVRKYIGAHALYR